MSKVDEFLREDPLEESSLDARVDLARIAAYSVFSEEKSSNDFYFENLLNSFIALVQYPISFAVLKRGEVSFHLCHDKEHYQWFSKRCESETWDETNSYALFPDVLGGDFRIAVYFMHTKKFDKKGKVTLISKAKNTFPCENLNQYIAACAIKFFEECWYGFRTMFSLQAKEALSNSLKKLSETYAANGERIWPQPAREIFDLQRKHGVDHPNTRVETWHNRVDELLSNVINDSRYGIRAFTGLNHIKHGGSVVEPYWKEIQPPNMLVAYRSYSRRLKSNDFVKPRHVTLSGFNRRTSGYAHNVNFVVPVRSVDAEGGEQDLDPYSLYFQFLKRQFSNDWEKSYEAEDTGRVLYRSLFDLLVKDEDILSKKWKKKIKDLRSIGRSADKRFWEILSDGPDGVEKIAGVLRSQVGDYARSMADPVFSTGIIHINPGYELGGLDRIQEKHIAGKRSFDELEFSVQQDILRIVAVYYYFSGAASWAGKMPRANDPRKLNLMLLPIKMRGAVWGVSVHAFYLEDFDLSFQYNSSWMSNFLLATSARQKSQGRFDSVLWEAVQQRVMRLLIKKIGATRTPSDFIEAIHEINRKIKGEQLLTPYALPQFTPVVAQDDSRGERNGVWFVGHKTGTDPVKGDLFVRLEWTVEENEFFSSRQPWSKRGTRSFLNIVDLGLKRGIEQMKSRR